MTARKKSCVSIVKVQEEHVEQAVVRLCAQLGGLSRFLLPLDTVLLKPNWVTDLHYSTGAVTHTELIRACVNLLLKHSAKKVIIADGAMVGKKTEDVILKNGVDQLASRRVEVLDFKKSQYTKVVVPNALKYPRLALPNELLESDVVINLPVMKTHDAFPVTLGLKNMKGVLSDRDKRRFHLRGLDEGVIDLNKAARANLTVTDGIIGMEGNGPTNGTPAHSKVLIASEDPLAAEVAAIAVMGFDAQEFEYIHMAYEAGFGQKDLSEIEIVGENIESVKRPFQTSYYTGRSAYGNIEIIDGMACSGCRDAIVQFLSNNRQIEKHPDVPITIVAGQPVSASELTHGGRFTMGIGKCTKACASQYDIHVPGCAPLKTALDRAYQEIVKKAGR